MLSSAAGSLPSSRRPARWPNCSCYYNSQHPHRALDRQTPIDGFNARLKAKPAPSPAPFDHRVRHDKVDRFGKLTLRYLGRLRHIPAGAAHKNASRARCIDLQESFLRLKTTVLPMTKNAKPIGVMNEGDSGTSANVVRVCEAKLILADARYRRSRSSAHWLPYPGNLRRAAAQTGTIGV